MRPSSSHKSIAVNQERKKIRVCIILIIEITFGFVLIILSSSKYFRSISD